MKGKLQWQKEVSKNAGKTVGGCESTLDTIRTKRGTDQVRRSLSRKVLLKTTKKLQEYLEDQLHKFKQEEGKAFEKGTKNDEVRIVDMPDWYMNDLEQYYKFWRQQRWENDAIWQGGDREYLFHNGTGKPLYHTTPTGWWNDRKASRNPEDTSA